MSRVIQSHARALSSILLTRIKHDGNPAWELWVIYQLEHVMSIISIIVLVSCLGCNRVANDILEHSVSRLSTPGRLFSRCMSKRETSFLSARASYERTNAAAAIGLMILKRLQEFASSCRRLFLVVGGRRGQHVGSRVFDAQGSIAGQLGMYLE